jgi:hypothetical protein
MKKLWEIKYQKAGQVTNDKPESVFIYASNVMEAIEIFEKTEIITAYTNIIYNRYAIISIS